jgi:hypothetical protein
MISHDILIKKCAARKQLQDCYYHSQKKHQHNLFNLPNHRTNKATDEIIVHSFVCMDSRSSRFQRAGFVAVFVQF